MKDWSMTLRSETPDATATNAPSLEDLRREALDLVTWHVSIEESRTLVLQRLADVVITIRSRFIDPATGNPDWRGKSYDYRMFMTGFYEATGLPPDSLQTIQAALRYHIGNRLRDRVPAEELAAIGLKTTSPRERMAAARNEAAAIKVALDDATPPHSTRDLVQRWSNYTNAIKRVVERLEYVEARRLPTSTARLMQQEVEEAMERLRRVSRVLGDRATPAPQAPTSSEGTREEHEPQQDAHHFHVLIP